MACQYLECYESSVDDGKRYTVPLLVDTSASFNNNVSGNNLGLEDCGCKPKKCTWWQWFKSFFVKVECGDDYSPPPEDCGGCRGDFAGDTIEETACKVEKFCTELKDRVCKLELCVQGNKSACVKNSCTQFSEGEDCGEADGGQKKKRNLWDPKKRHVVDNKKCLTQVNKECQKRARSRSRSPPRASHCRSRSRTPPCGQRRRQSCSPCPDPCNPCGDPCNPCEPCDPCAPIPFKMMEFCQPRCSPPRPLTSCPPPRSRSACYTSCANKCALCTDCGPYCTCAICGILKDDPQPRQACPPKRRGRTPPPARCSRKPCKTPPPCCPPRGGRPKSLPMLSKCACCDLVNPTCPRPKPCCPRPKPCCPKPKPCCAPRPASCYPSCPPSCPPSGGVFSGLSSTYGRSPAGSGLCDFLVNKYSCGGPSPPCCPKYGNRTNSRRSVSPITRLKQPNVLNDVQYAKSPDKTKKPVKKVHLSMRHYYPCVKQLNPTSDVVLFRAMKSTERTDKINARSAMLRRYNPQYENVNNGALATCDNEEEAKCRNNNFGEEDDFQFSSTVDPVQQAQASPRTPSPRFDEVDERITRLDQWILGISPPPETMTSTGTTKSSKSVKKKKSSQGGIALSSKKKTSSSSGARTGHRRAQNVHASRIGHSLRTLRENRFAEDDSAQCTSQPQRSHVKNISPSRSPAKTVDHCCNDIFNDAELVFEDAPSSDFELPLDAFQEHSLDDALNDHSADKHAESEYPTTETLSFPPSSAPDMPPSEDLVRECSTNDKRSPERNTTHVDDMSPYSSMPGFANKHKSPRRRKTPQDNSKVSAWVEANCEIGNTIGDGEPNVDKHSLEKKEHSKMCLTQKLSNIWESTSQLSLARYIIGDLRPMESSVDIEITSKESSVDIFKLTSKGSSVDVPWANGFSNNNDTSIDQVQNYCDDSENDCYVSPQESMLELDRSYNK